MIITSEHIKSMRIINIYTHMINPTWQDATWKLKSTWYMALIGNSAHNIRLKKSNNCENHQTQY